MTDRTRSERHYSGGKGPAQVRVSRRGEPPQGQLGTLIDLQRLAGNKVVTRAVESASDTTAPHPFVQKLEPKSGLAAGGVPATLARRDVLNDFQRDFSTAFNGRGIARFFTVRLNSFRKTRKPPRGINVHSSLGSGWREVESAIKVLTQDIRAFRKTIAIQASSTSGETRYLIIVVSLRRSTVEASQEPAIEKSLVDVEDKYAYGSKKGLKVNSQAYESYKKLYEAAAKAGFMKEIPDLFKVVSEYRSVTQQEKLWSNKLKAVRKAQPKWADDQVVKEARKWVAKPGGSAHHTGLALDLFMGWPIGSKNASLMQDKNSQLYRKYGKYWEWMKKNAPTYGFLPYAAEPWHWEAWQA